jgi:hypothetical protein
MNVSDDAFPVVRSRTVMVVTLFIRLMVTLLFLETAVVNDPIFLPLLLIMSMFCCSFQICFVAEQRTHEFSVQVFQIASNLL